MSYTSDQDGFPKYHDEWDPKPPPRKPTKSQSTSWVVGCLAGIGILAVLGCICGVGMSLWLVLSYGDVTAHIDHTFEAARNHPQVQEELGLPMKPIPLLDSSMHFQERDGNVEMEVEYKIQGPKSEGTVHFRAIKNGNRWTYPEAWVKVPGAPGKIRFQVEPLIEPIE